MSQGFSIENYRKRDDGAPEECRLPAWVDLRKSKIVALVQATDKEFERIQLLITGTQNELSVSQRQIKKNVVCSAAGVVPSYLRADRADSRQVLEYLEQKNKLLNELWKKALILRSNSGRKLLKADLVNENRRLEREIQDLQTAKYLAYFDEWVEQNVVSDQKRLRAQISDLKSKITALEEEKAVLKLDLEKAREQIRLALRARNEKD